MNKAVFIRGLGFRVRAHIQYAGIEYLDHRPNANGRRLIGNTETMKTLVTNCDGR